MKRYPLIELMAAHGRKIALGVALLIAFGAIVRAGLDRNVVALAWTVFGAAVCYVGVRLLAELIEVIADTLMPR
jgi:hypothetical protein